MERPPILYVSPYQELPAHKWASKTVELIQAHPLQPTEIVEVALQAWSSIFESSIGGLHIGTDLFPTPQIMGDFLHALIPHEFSRRYPGKWRKEQEASEKDLVCIHRPEYSTEIKTSSHPRNIYGNRSYAQPDQGTGKKGKSGYYIAVNFAKFQDARAKPKIVRIRCGWLDHIDWIPQKSATGQQASLSAESRGSKLIELYPNKSQLLK